MAAFEKAKADLQRIGARVIAASVDPRDEAGEVAAALTYPVAYGVTREIAERIGAWWEERRGIIQPSEFVLGADGKVIASTYSSGPIGRIEPADVVRHIEFRERQAKKG